MKNSRRQTHLSVASGGAYVVLYSSFFEHLDEMPGGRAFCSEIDTVSGSSAGALVGSAVACGIPGKSIHQYALKSGIRDRFYYLRTAAVMMGLKKTMYNSTYYAGKLRALLAQKDTAHLPLTIAVTNGNLTQKCVRLQNSSIDDIATAAMASAAVPFVFSPLRVDPHGYCADGSCAVNVYPHDTIVDALYNNTGRLVVLNSCPWPGYRDVDRKTNKPGFLSVQSLLKNYDTQLYDHGMERTFDFHIKPQLQYQDGIFQIRVDNRSSPVPTISETGNLQVIFVAPTAEQYHMCGGAKSKANLHYKRSDASVIAMQQVARQMALQFVSEYGSLQF